MQTVPRTLSAASISMKQYHTLCSQQPHLFTYHQQRKRATPVQSRCIVESQASAGNSCYVVFNLTPSEILLNLWLVSSKTGEPPWGSTIIQERQFIWV